MLHSDEVDGVEDDRHNGGHTAALVVNCTHIPGRPPALGGTRDRVVVQALDVQLLGRVGGDSVHGSHRGLDHWQTNQPLGFIRVIQEMCPCEGDNRVLPTGFLLRVGGEHHLLVRDLKQAAGDQTGAHGQLGCYHHVVVETIRDILRVVIGPIGDPESSVAWGTGIII